MDNWAVGRLIDWATGKDGKEATKASLKEELCELADELAGPSPSPVEQVLAETAATSWFALRLSGLLPDSWSTSNESSQR